MKRGFDEMGTDTMNKEIKDITEGLFRFLRKSPTAFHAVKQIGEELEAFGYEELREEQVWDIVPGGKYYVIRNSSSIIAFQVGTELTDYSFQIAASHSDSPSFKVKENGEIQVKGKYLQLNTEGYGGMLCSTWFDRPLGVAGRVLVKEGNRFVTRLFDSGRDLVVIPSLAIHMNRKANEGTAYNKQVDMLPLFGGGESETGDFKKLVAEGLGIEQEAVYGSDLYLYSTGEPTVFGAREEYILASHLDDLQCAYASLQGFLKSSHPETVSVYACFDNEEVGSGTKQGAGSTFLYDTLRRINAGLSKSEEEYYRAVAESFMASADNAHAVHPNHPEKTDAANCVYMNEGVVIKSHAGQKYTSDGVSVALFRQICENAGVPVQFFANRSDEAGGSTLGNISSGKVSLNAVDIGLAQLAMHSACETAGVKDTYYMVKAMESFYRSRICTEGSSFFVKV